MGTTDNSGDSLTHTNQSNEQEWGMKEKNDDNILSFPQERIVAQAISPEGPFFPVLIDQLLVRLKTIVKTEGDNTSFFSNTWGEKKYEPSLEQELLTFILQTIMSSVMLWDNDTQNEWYQIFYNYIKSEGRDNNIMNGGVLNDHGLSVERIDMLHKSVYHLIHPQRQQQPERQYGQQPQREETIEDAGIGLLFAAAAETSTSLFSGFGIQEPQQPPLLHAATPQQHQQQPSLLGAKLSAAMDTVVIDHHTEKQSTKVPPSSSIPSSLRSLPPPLFPIIGKDQTMSTNIGPSPPGQQHQQGPGVVGLSPSFTTPLTGAALEQLKSELIWLGPQYPSNRLALMIPEEEEYGSRQKKDIPNNELSNNDSTINRGDGDAEIIDILKNRAFVIPLPPLDERRVLDALTGADIAVDKNYNNNNNKATGAGGKKNKKKKKSKKQQQASQTNTSGGRKVVEQRALRLILESGLTPQNLSRIVEKNPIVAIECLILILTSTEVNDITNKKNEFLSSLAGMDMSIHSMEVVNRLATYSTRIGGGGAAAASAQGKKGQQKKQQQRPQQSDKGGDNITSEPLLHSEYIHLYISTCISSCESMSYDRHLQNKSVRLLCVFLQSLIRNGIVDVEVSSVCTLFKIHLVQILLTQRKHHILLSRICLLRFKHFALSFLAFVKQLHCFRYSKQIAKWDDWYYSLNLMPIYLQ